MRINRFIVVLVAFVALTTPALARQPASGRAAPPASPAAVITWNEIAQRAAIQVAKLSPPHSIIAISFAQAAVYDAVVVIDGGYQPYQVRLGQLPTANVDAAVATAAHHVLVHYFPAQHAALDADYAGALAAIADGQRGGPGTERGTLDTQALLPAGGLITACGRGAGRSSGAPIEREP